MFAIMKKYSKLLFLGIAILMCSACSKPIEEDDDELYSTVREDPMMSIPAPIPIPPEIQYPQP